MRKFEYKVLKLDLRGGLFSAGGKVNVEALNFDLTKLGDQGWELVNTVNTSKGHGYSRDLALIFKKDKK